MPTTSVRGPATVANEEPIAPRRARPTKPTEKIREDPADTEDENSRTENSNPTRGYTIRHGLNGNGQHQHQRQLGGGYLYTRTEPHSKVLRHSSTATTPTVPTAAEYLGIHLVPACDELPAA
jgi:hypothetical protein